MVINRGRIVNVGLVSADKGLGFVEIPVEKIVNGEVVTVATKAIPILENKMTNSNAANYSDNGAHNLTAEERARGLEGVLPASEVLPHQRTNNSNNTK